MDERATSDEGLCSQSATHSSEAFIKPRPAELEDWLNGRIYHPLSMRLAKGLAETFVTPNMVSIAGGGMIVLAAVTYGMASSWMGAALGLLLHMGWHVLDGADGDLARLTGRTSSTGEVIDGICDYVGHIILYLVLAYMMSAQWGMAAYAFAAAAGAGRIVQAAHYEVQRRQYQHWVYGNPWLRVSSKESGKPSGIIGLFASYYVFLTRLLAPGGHSVDAVVDGCGGQAREKVQAIIRKEIKPVLGSTYLLSANYRTIALGLSMLLSGSALYFFVFEAIFLSLVMIVSIFVARRSARRILDQAEL